MSKPKVADVVDLRKTLTDDPVLYLSKLSWEIAQVFERPYASNAERIFLSLNAAESAWHIHEWLWKIADAPRRRHLLKLAKAKGTDLQAFALGMQRLSPAVSICRQLATAHKHFTVKHNRDDVFFEVLHDEEREEHRTTVQIAHQGEVHRDVDVYLSALAVWSRIYVALGYPSARDVLSIAPEHFDPSRSIPR